MSRIRLTAVYGGGSLWGIGFGVGIATALGERGLALDVAPSIGTSAGAWVAAAVRLGVRLETLFTIDVRPPYDEDGVLEGFGRMAFGDALVPGVRAVAVRADAIDTHELLDGGRLPAAQIVAASSAVPGLFVPVTIDGVPYVDGMMTGSCTNVDLALDADHLVVIAPMASMALPGGERCIDVVDAEIERWVARNPAARVDVWAPDDYCCSLAGADADFFDMEMAVEVGLRAYAQVQTAIDAVA